MNSPSDLAGASLIDALFGVKLSQHARLITIASSQDSALPQALVDQLADDGVMVAPVNGTMLRVTHPGAVVTEHGRYRFVPLR